MTTHFSLLLVDVFLLHGMDFCTTYFAIEPPIIFTFSDKRRRAHDPDGHSFDAVLNRVGMHAEDYASVSST